MNLSESNLSQIGSHHAASPRVCDIVIVGAGIIGCSIAVAALQQGFSVTLVDRNTQPGFGSTSSSAGIVRVHAMDRESVILADASVLAWEAWRDHTQTPSSAAVAEFVRCGSIILDSGDDLVERLASTMTAAGALHSFLDADQVADRFPYLDLHRFGPPSSTSSADFWSEPSGMLGGALHTPSSGYVGDPALAAQNLADQAARAGANFLLGSTVVGFADATEGAIDVHVDDGTVVHAAVAINAAGPHSKLVNALAGVGEDFMVGLRNLRQELHYIPMPDHINLSRNGVHVVDGDLGINFRPDGHQAILVGGNGASIDPTEVIDDPDAFRTTPTRAGWLTHSLRAARRIPGLGVPSRPMGVAGLYDATDDWLPIYDRTDRSGFFVAIGTSGNQFKTAPVIGDLMVQLVSAALDGRDTDRDPLTFTPSGSNLSIDSSVFSRRRSPSTGGMRG